MSQKENRSIVILERILLWIFGKCLGNLGFLYSIFSKFVEKKKDFLNVNTSAQVKKIECTV